MFTRLCQWWAGRRQRRIQRAIAALRRYRATVARTRRIPDLARERRFLRRVYRAWRS